MKKVAGFHSFDLAFFFSAALGELLRRGLGIRLIQNEVWAMLGAPAYCRAIVG